MKALKATIALTSLKALDAFLDVQSYVFNAVVQHTIEFEFDSVSLALIVAQMVIKYRRELTNLIIK